MAEYTVTGQTRRETYRSIWSGNGKQVYRRQNKNRLNLPSILVLDGCGITEAGDEEEVATFCAHVVELDLSHNQLKDWGEISKILYNIPNLDFLNLSMNPLRGSSLEPGVAEAFSPGWSRRDWSQPGQSRRPPGRSRQNRSPPGRSRQIRNPWQRQTTQIRPQ
uniref:Tubulin folding cofactor E-like a n=1 Tax=Sinocyclocheilus grahami TaxID=75366 RepID=A0A672PWX2_SINGR